MRRSATARVLVSALFAACAAPQEEGIDPGPELSAIVLSPASVNLATGDSAVFQATGRLSDGSTIAAPTLTWTATGGTVSAGVYHAGGSAGNYRVIASTTDGRFGDTAAVTLSTTPVPVTLTGLTVLPATDTLLPGANRQFSVQGHYSNGVTDTVSVTWSATGGSISSGGSYHAGNTVGSYRVIATAVAASVADTAQVVIRAATPSLTAVVVTPASATLDPGGTQAFTATGQFSDGSSGPVNVNWSATGGTVSSSGLYTAGSNPGNYRVIAAATTGSRSDTSQIAIRDTATPPPSGTVLLTEEFENSDAGARGWYANTNPAISTTEHHSGVGSLQMAWQAGATNPVQGVSLRHLFTASDRVYVRMWLKYSSNFVGSGKSYHPHEFEFLTDADDMWIGPSQTHLSTLFEHNWQNGNAYPRVTTTDGLNIDPTRIGVDLTTVTEQRATAGCNGNSDGYATACYQSGSEWFNGKEFISSQAAFTTTQGASYKNNWHKVEVYLQMNSIAGGKGQNDGVAQYWFDGQLKIDLHDVLFRTGANANLKFNQFMIAPYIGDGSPVAQTFWMDDLVIATGPVP